MQAIRGLFLIVPSFIMSICSLTQERTDSNQPLYFVDEISYDSYTLNPFSQSDCSTSLASDVNNRNNDNLVISELDANDSFAQALCSISSLVI